MADLDAVWRDDQLIEALARGALVDGDDPAVAPLRALTHVADGEPLPDLGPAVPVGPGAVDPGRHHRYAVRSLAIAMTVVATLSGGGVAAVVTGDPFRPAKAVWHQIQIRTDDTVDARAPRVDTGRALGTAVRPATPVLDHDHASAPRADEPARAQRDGETAPVAPADAEAATPTDAGRQRSDGGSGQQAGPRPPATAAGHEPARQPTQDSSRPQQVRQPEEESGEGEPEQESADEQQRQPGQRTEPEQDREQEPPPEEPTDDALEPLVLPDRSGQDEQDDGARSAAPAEPPPAVEPEARQQPPAVQPTAEEPVDEESVAEEPVAEEPVAEDAPTAAQQRLGQHDDE